MPAPIIVQTGNNPIKTIGILLGLGVAGVAAYKGYAWYKAKSGLTNQIDSTITPAKGKKMFDLTGKPLKSANLGTIASDLNSSLSSFFVDNPRVVRVFQGTPFGYVPKLEEFYLNQYGKNLRDTLVDKLKDESWIKIKYNFK